MLNLIFIKKDDTEEKLNEYFKRGSNKPDFTENLATKLKELDKRKNPQYLFEIMYIINSTDDTFKRVELMQQLIEEIIIHITEMYKNDKDNLHSN